MNASIAVRHLFRQATDGRNGLVTMCRPFSLVGSKQLVRQAMMALPPPAGVCRRGCTEAAPTAVGSSRLSSPATEPPRLKRSLPARTDGVLLPSLPPSLPPSFPSLPQVLYHATGRSTVVGYGLIGFSSIFAGMLLFTISSPHFYFYGVPTLYTLISMCCHCECLVCLYLASCVAL